MKRNNLGFSGLEVSPLCFGTLTVGPIQKNFSPAKAAEIFCRGYELGVNFFDTAEIYGTYQHLALSLKKYPDLVIASKSYAVTYLEMHKSIEKARLELERDYIDIFAIHELENSASIKGHQGALDCLVDAKNKGIIKAVGISTHTVAGVRAGATDPRIDVIHPLINQAGIGIKDGTLAEMVTAIQTAKEFGKGIYAMKVLAGGHLIQDVVASIQYILNLKLVDSMAIGIQSEAELLMNWALINGENVSAHLLTEIGKTERYLKIADWCVGCGRCIVTCGFAALEMVNCRPQVNQDKCLRCGYCARVCPEFCLKVV